MGPISLTKSAMFLAALGVEPTPSIRASDGDVEERPAPSSGGSGLSSSAAAPPPPWGTIEVSSSSDEEVDAPGEEVDAPGEKRKRKAHGSAEDRWATRCSVDAIQADQKQGCTSACGCVRRLSLEEIQQQRVERSHEKMKGRREFIRQYFEMNAAPNTAFGFSLHTQHDNGRLLCVQGFAVYHGLTPQFLYHHRKRFMGGDRADDPNLGGKRRCGAAAGEAFSEDSQQFHMFNGWFKDLYDDTECMPNSRQRQIDFIEKQELFAECKSDLRDAGTLESSIGSMVRHSSSAGACRAHHPTPPHDNDYSPNDTTCLHARTQALWCSIWKGRFSDLVVREVKQVCSKDRKRSELRRLLRRTVTRDATMRELIKELRHLYREALRVERSFYWAARIRPAQVPLLYLTYIQDGATQRCAQPKRTCIHAMTVRMYAVCTSALDGWAQMLVVTVSSGNSSAISSMVMFLCCTSSCHISRTIPTSFVTVWTRRLRHSCKCARPKASRHSCRRICAFSWTVSAVIGARLFSHTLPTCSTNASSVTTPMWLETLWAAHTKTLTHCLALRRRS